MDKGIRPFCNNLFVQLNEERRRGLLSNLQFRKNVRITLMEEFGITEASASTHYNHAFKTLKELNAELVSGLGRPPEKNNGGRKKKATLVAEAVTLLLGYTPAAVEFIDQQYTECVAAAAGAIGPVDVVDQVPNGWDKIEGGEEVAPAKTYTVTRVKDGAVIATGLLLTDAEALCAKAVAAKKAKLAFA